MLFQTSVPTELNQAAVAALYSPLAGVLAGFAFAGVLLVATERLSRPSDTPSAFPDARESSLVLLLAAFLGLSINSLTYSIIGGETEPYERAAVMHVLAGGGFAVSALALIFAVYVLINNIAPVLSPWIRSAVGLWAPFVLSVYVTAGVIQAQQIVRPVDLKLSVLIWIAVAAIHVIAASVANKNQNFTPRLRQTKHFASFSIGMAIISSIGVALLQTIDPTNISTWPAWLAFFVVLIIMVEFTAKVGSRP